LTNLLFKLYELQAGKIEIDGQPIENMSMTKISKLVGIVMQEPALFNRTVYENVKYNNKNATPDDIIMACREAKAYDFIEKANFGL